MGRRQAAAGEVGTALQRYQRSVHAFDDAVGRSIGLVPSDVRCLDWVADGPRSVTELAAATGLRAPATSAMVDRLVKRGLVSRGRADGDRRQVVVTMTEFGRRLTSRYYEPLVADGFQSLQRYTIDELNLVRDILMAITAMTERHRAALLPASAQDSSDRD